VSSSREFIEGFLEQSRQLIGSIDQHLVEQFVDVLAEAWKRGSTTYLCGNGGPASTAQHMAADLMNCTRVEGKPRFRALSLNDNMPLISALTNDEGWGRVYTSQLETWWRPGDVLLAISVHGGSGEDRAGPWSQNLVNACRYANEHGGQSLAFVGFDGGLMRDLCSVCLTVRIDSTTHTEGLHPLIHHLVTTLLHARMQQL